MNAAGIVVEYNPFHNGHLYHINETRRLSNADVIIAVMSGSFLQRGEPAVVDKWTRTKMALLNGADLVVELPYAFSTQKAETFAEGAIQILHHLKCQFFCFGSEDGKTSTFLQSAVRLEEKKEQLNQQVQIFVKEGMSYPSAQTKARNFVFQDDPLPLDLAKPNNILGYHYIAANYSLGSPLKPIAIQRQGAGFHDQEASGTIASATAIRKILHENSQKASAFMPATSFSLLNNRYLHSWESYWPLLRYRLLSIRADHLNSIYEIEEGIGPRLVQAALKSDSFASFIDKVKTKRYTRTRLQRMITHILTDTTKQEMQRNQKALFIRLLGMTESGRAYVRSVKKDISVPFVSRTAAGLDLLSLDLKASRVYASAFDAPPAYTAALLDQEFSFPPILL